MVFSGSCQITNPGQLSSGNNTLTFDTLSQGLHDDCYITPTDLVGNTGSVLHISPFTIDTTAPVITITSPGSGSTLSGTVTITATGSDIGGSGIAKVRFYYYSQGTYIGEDTTAPYSIDWNTVGIVDGDGSHHIRAIMYDNVGNIGSAIDIPVTVDNNAPNVTKLGDGNSDYELPMVSP